MYPPLKPLIRSPCFHFKLFCCLLAFTSVGNVPAQPQVPLLELFALDSDCHEPDGTTSTSIQAQWLKQALSDSNALWKFVMLHHSPYSSSSSHGTNPRTQW
jgi:hypothetical protein